MTLMREGREPVPDQTEWATLAVLAPGYLAMLCRDDQGTIEADQDYANYSL